MEEGAGREGRRKEGRGRDSERREEGAGREGGREGEGAGKGGRSRELPLPPSFPLLLEFAIQILAATIFVLSSLSLDLHTSPWIFIPLPGSCSLSLDLALPKSLQRGFV
jgi:hypothetical protein